MGQLDFARGKLLFVLTCPIGEVRKPNHFQYHFKIVNSPSLFFISLEIGVLISCWNIKTTSSSWRLLSFSSLVRLMRDWNCEEKPVVNHLAISVIFVQLCKCHTLNRHFLKQRTRPFDHWSLLLSICNSLEVITFTASNVDEKGTRGRFLKGGINYTRYNSYSMDKSAILGITITGIKMGSRKHYLSLE